MERPHCEVADEIIVKHIWFYVEFCVNRRPAHLYRSDGVVRLNKVVGAGGGHSDEVVECRLTQSSETTRRKSEALYEASIHSQCSASLQRLIAASETVYVLVHLV
ncbi:hypothetical protein LSAT2_009136, partial [Lamellibrachia satsuma]